MTPIKLVSGDNLPNVQVTLTNETTGLPIDLSPANTIISVKMRALGTTTVIATLAGSVVNTGTDGLMQFGFPGTSLQVVAGAYEFQISVSFNGNLETVYETLKAQIRAPF